MKTNSLNNRSSYFATQALACVALFSFAAPSVKAANFTSGNLVVAVAAASLANTSASIVELSPSTAAQTAVQTIPLTASSYRVSGSATSTMYMANSADGSLATLTVVKSSDTASNANTLTARGVITINNAATVANPASYTGSSGNQTRGASSINNTTWFIGDQGGFYTDGATSASPSGNIRGVKAFGSAVYAMTSSTTAPHVGIISAATGGTYTALTGLPNGTASGQDFYLIQSGSSGTTYDVLYILSATSATAGTIAKYSLVSGTWTANGTYTTTFGGFGLAVKKGSGSTADLFVSSGTGATTANILYKLTDTAGYNATIAITTGNNISLYTAATGTIIKGVAFAPVAAAATPTITGATTASAFTTTYGTASTAQTFTIGGSNLSASITATAPTGFEVSSDGTTYGTTATFTQSGGTASGSLRVRLAATATPGTSYDSKNIVLSSTGASSVNIATASTGNTVSKKALTITGLTGASKDYTGTTSASVTGTAALSGFVGSDTATLDSSSASWTYATAAVGTAKTITASGYAISGGQSSYYTLTQPTSTADITARSLTITASNVTKAAGAVLTGGSGSTAFTSSGLQNSETIGSVTITYGSGAAGNAAGGVYAGAVVPSAATGGTFTASNYSISYTAGSITVNASPTITATGTLANVGTTYGTASASPTSFTVSGGNLTGDLSVAAPSGFEISTSSGSGYASSLSLAQSSGSVSNTTIYVRLAATTGAGTYSGNVTITGGGATAQNVATASSTVATKALTITGLSGVNKVYDASNTAGTSGTAAYVGLVNGDSFTVTGTPAATFADANVGTAKVVSVTGITAPSLNYSVSPLLLAANITQKALTVASAAVTTKTYDGSNAAVVTGTLTGVVGSDTVNFSGTGTFADANAGTGIAVTSTSTISGAQSANYSLTQPTGLTGDITKASQTITFGALANKTTADVPFALSATTTATGLTVAYSSSNPAVATVSGSTVTIVGPGSSTITASQAGNQNYNGATSVQQTLTVSAVPTLTEVYVPQFMEGGMGSSNSKRIPCAFRVTLTNLNPSTTYRYYNSAVIDADTATSTGAGNPIFVTDTGNFVRSTGGSLSTAGNYSTLTTDANGSYTGWFMLEPTANATRFQVSGNVKMRIILNSGVSGNTTATTFLTTASYVAVTPFGSAIANGTAIRGASSATAKNFVLLYDNTTGTGRPLAATVVEGDGVANTTANSYASFYATNVDEQSGAWGTIIPNNLANGVRRIENRAKADGSLIAYSTDSDGTWPSGVSTVNPNGGDTTVLVIASTDAPLVVPPQIASSGSLSALSTTYGTASSSTQFSISGANMTAGILVTPPSGFEVSTDNSAFSGTVTVGASGTISSTTVYVRLAATASAGNKSGNIVLSSSGAANVNLATVASTVIQKGVTISGLSGVNKVYDGSTTATTSGTASYVGLVNGETYSVLGTPTASFADSSVGTNKLITITGYSAPTANYSLMENPTTTADITAKGLTITGISIANKTYDGTTAATITGTAAYSGLVGSESFAVAGTPSAVFVSAATGNGKTVAVSGYTAPNGNYSITQPTGLTANISAVSLGSGDITITPVGDGSFTASASGGVTFTYSYAGRTANGYATSYSASATAATAPGYYTVTATSSNPNYTGSKSVQYFIAGLVPNGGLTKPSDNQPFVIEQAGLLAKISRITTDGSLVAGDLAVGSVASVTGLGGSSAELDGTDILYTPTSSASDSLRVAISGYSYPVTIAVATEGSAPTFTLQIVKVGTAVYSSGSTAMTNDFIGVPNQSYEVEYSTDLTNWVSAGSVNTGATGSFSVTLSQASDVAATWNRALFFRAKVSVPNR